MANHLSKLQIDRYSSRSLSPAELISVCGHLETCESCREEVGGADQLDNAFTIFGADLERAADQDRFHLSPELSLAYVKGDIGEIDAQIVESHVDNCPECAAELRDLNAFELQLGELRDRSRETASTTSLETRPTAWMVFKGFWLSLTRWRVVQATALVLLVALLVATISLQNRVQSLTARLNELETGNNAVQQENSSLAASKDETEIAAAVDANANTREITVALNDAGKRVTLYKDGALAGLVELPAHYERVVTGMLRTGEAPVPPDVSELAGKRETMMGSPNAAHVFQLLSPVGVVLLNNRPIFNWTALEGATGYTVDVFNSDLKRVAGSEEIQLKTWTPPHDLQQGGIYIWQVTAIRDGKEIISPAPPAPQARFKVLDRASMNELTRARSRYPTSHLVLGGIYSQAGLLEDAEREFKMLLSANTDSPIARKLLQSVQAARR